MAELIARAALRGLPLEVGGLRLGAVERRSEQLVMPYRGREAVVAKALAPLGLPAPNTAIVAGGAAALWAGAGKALLVNADLPQALAQDAAVVDQTGAQAVVLVSGAGVDEVLARLVPIDLRHAAFPVGSVALTLLGHMTAQLRRTDAGIEVAVMRSMGDTLVHELTVAAKQVAARSGI